MKFNFYVSIHNIHTVQLFMTADRPRRSKAWSISVARTFCFFSRVHHHASRFLPFHLRRLLDFFSDFFSKVLLRISSLELLGFFSAMFSFIFIIEEVPQAGFLCVSTTVISCRFSGVDSLKNAINVKCCQHSAMTI